MELFIVILIFVVTMGICFVIGEGLDPRFKLPLKKEDGEDDAPSPEDFADSPPEEIQPEKETEPSDSPEESEEAQEPPSPEDEKEEFVEGTPESEEKEEGGTDEEEVIKGCVAEVLETPEQVVGHIADLARECAENIAKALGVTVLDFTTFTTSNVPPQEPPEKKDE